MIGTAQTERIKKKKGECEEGQMLLACDYAASDVARMLYWMNEVF